MPLKKQAVAYLVQFLLIFSGAALPIASASAAWVQGTGQAVIRNNDLTAAREMARDAALRDAALRYEANIASEDTMHNGVLTDSRLTVASQARARQVNVLEEQRSGDVIRLTVEAEMSKGSRCGAGAASRMSKRVAVTGFPLVNTDQARFGQIGDVDQVLPQKLQQRLQETGKVQVLSSSGTQLFPNPDNAPTSQNFDNSLTNVIKLARELDAQFVVTGVIRDLGMADPAAWGTSVLDRVQRSMGMANQKRRFVADLFVYDGYSGSPVYRKRFITTGNWDIDPDETTGFGSLAFDQTDYGKAVKKTMSEMSQAVSQALTCQPFMTRIKRVDGQQVYLSAGATSGLRPGDKLHLYRSYRFFDSPDATPELRDAKTTVTVNQVHPEFSSGLMPDLGGQLNLQRDDIAIVW